MVLFDVSARVPALKLANTFRQRSRQVVCQRKHQTPSVEDYIQMARRAGIRQMLYVFGDGSQIKIYDVASGTCSQTDLSMYQDSIVQ